MLSAGASLSQTTTTYTYDGAGRLIRAEDSSGQTATYTFDKAGNRTSNGTGIDANEYRAGLTFSASSVLAGTAAPSLASMADGVFDARTSVAATVVESNPWIRVDLGSAKTVALVRMAPPREASLSLDVGDTNGTVLEYSVDGTTWSGTFAVSSAVAATYSETVLGGVSARYLRVRRNGIGQVALGDLRVYSAVSSVPQVLTVATITFKQPSGSSTTINPIAGGSGRSLVSLGAKPNNGTFALTNNNTAITYTSTAGYVGPDTFSYNVQDQNRNAGVGVVTIDVTPNSSDELPGTTWPIAQNDFVNAVGGETITFNPLINDLSNDEMRIASVTLDAKTTPPGAPAALPATVTLLANGLVSFRASDFAVVGLDDRVLTYVVVDKFGRSNPNAGTLSSTGKIFVTIVPPPPPPNVAPIARNDTIVTPSKPWTFDPRNNDTDANRDTLTIESVGLASHGVVTINGGTSVTYTPDAGYAGPDSFTYSINDGNGEHATASVAVTVVPNTPPVAVADLIAATAGVPSTFDPRVNDRDIDADTLTITAVMAPGHGTLTIGPAGQSLIYTPSPGYTGADNFSYTISDGFGGSAVATVSATVYPGPRVFLISPAVNGRTKWNLDVDGPMALGAAGTWTVTPQSSFVSTIKAWGAGGGRTLAAGGGGGYAGGAVVFQSGIVYRLDVGAGGGVSATTAGGTPGGGNGGTDGSASGSGGGGFTGLRKQNDLSSVLIAGGGGGGAWGGAGGGGGGANGAAGVAWGGAAGGAAGTQSVGTSYVGGNAGTYGGGGGSGYRGGGGGAAGGGGGGGGGGGSGFAHATEVTSASLVAANGSIPGNDTDVARGTAGAGGTGSSAAPGSAGKWLFDGFVNNNNAPSLANDTVTLTWSSTRTFDPRANDSDPNGDTFTITAIGTPANGVATIVSGGTGVTYTPTRGYTGSDSFSYTVTDERSGTSTATIIMVVTEPTNTAPTVVGDLVTVRSNVAKSFDPRTNDSDAEFDAFSVTGAGAPAHGTASVSGGGASVTYTPTSGYSGPDSFSYSVTDARGAIATALVSITVVANTAPNALPDAVNATAATTLTFNPRSNDTDVDNDTLTITALSAPSNGTALITGGGTTLSYLANAGYYGSDSFTYTISDGQGGSATATVTVAVLSNYRIFTISPSVSGRTTWNLDLDGSLSLPTAGTWTITPLTTFAATAKAWGAGGGTSLARGGAAGYSGGSVQLQSGIAYRLDVGAGGGITVATAGGAPGGGTGGTDGSASGAGGGGFTGLRKQTDLSSVLIAGGGGGGAWGGAGGGGGGSNGASGAAWGGSAGGAGGTQSIGTSYIGGAAGTYGGGGGGGYRGGGGGAAGGGGGGGGSGFAHATEVTNSSLVAANGAVPGNEADPDRGSAGATPASSGAGSAGKWILVGVSGTNGAPSATNDNVTKSWIQTLTLDPRVNDTDPNGDPLTITAVGSTTNGTATINNGASITFVSTPGYAGAASFTYTISDGRGATSTANVNVTIVANTTPVATADVLTAVTATSQMFDPRINDTDADGDALTITSVTNPANGVVVRSPSGTSLSYTSTAGYTGSDSFSYTVTDTKGAAATAVITVTVLSVHRVFTISPAVSGKTTWNLDLDGSLALPTAGTWTVTPQTTFTATAKAWGAGAGSSLARGGAGGYAGGNVQFQSGVTYRLDVGAAGGVTTLVAGGAPGGGTGGSNGSGGGGFTGLRKQGDLSAVLIAGGGGGGAWGGLGGGGGGTSGQAGATYGSSAGGAAGTQSVGTAYVGGTGVSYAGGGGGGYRGGGGGAFVSGGGGGGGGGSGFAHATEVTSSSLLAASGFTPGNDNDTDRGTAGSTPTSSGAGNPGKWILAGVVGTNGAPFAVTDTRTTTWMGAVTLDPRANDNDPNRDPLTLVSVATPATGTASMAGGSITYTPVPGYVGSVTFNYTINDGRGATATGSIVITVVAPTNTAPTAANDTTTTRANTPKTFDPRTNDTDAELDAFSVTSASAPTRGTVSLGGGGASITYTPAAGYAGADSFTYTVTDARGASATGSISVTVTPNTIPVANPDAVTTTAATAVVINPRTNDSDADGDTLTVTAVSAPSNGSTSISGGGTTVTYIATSGYGGPDSFTYTISDGQGGSATSTVTVAVSSNVRTFTISPAVSGKTTWNLDVDGPLNLGAAGVWTLTPTSTFNLVVKAWGGGGGSGALGSGGGGGFATGTVSFQSGTAYSLTVGGSSAGASTSGTTGGGGGGGPGGGGAGGGYSGLRIGTTSVLISGGGGAGGFGGNGGAGGGAVGADGTPHAGDNTQGRGGSASAGGIGGSGNGSAGAATSGGAGGTSTGNYGGGGGGGGHFGGGGGGYAGSSGAGGGGGGASFANPTYVSSATLTAGSGVTPGNSGDADRSGAGSANGGAGRIVLKQ